MKYLFSLLLLSCLSFGAMAQAGSLQVRNNSGCWAHYFVMGGPGCSLSVFGTVVSIAPGATVTYTSPSMVPGFPGGVPFILGAGLNNKSTTCSGFAVGRVGEACTGMLPAWGPYASFTPNCAPCGNINATWVPAPGVGGMARLIFN